MKIIPSAFHGILDYAVALALVAGPILLGFSGLALGLGIAGGIGLFLYSLVTDYSTSVQKLLPFGVHLLLDAVAAVALIAAPFLFGFGPLATGFYLVIGLAVIVVVLVTNPEIETGTGQPAE